MRSLDSVGISGLKDVQRGIPSRRLASGTWRASPFDICRAFAELRRLPQGSEAFKTVDAALGAGVAQPEVRNRWDRVWYKGGDLSSGANGKHVLTHA